MRVYVCLSQAPLRRMQSIVSMVAVRPLDSAMATHDEQRINMIWDGTKDTRDCIFPHIKRARCSVTRGV